MFSKKADRSVNVSCARERIMKLHRVTFTTSMLVEAEDSGSAARIGRIFLQDEISSGLSRVASIDIVTSVGELHRWEHASVPRRDPQRNDEPKMTAEDILDPLPITRKEIPPEGISRIELHKTELDDM